MQNPEKSVMIITYNMIPYVPQWGACQRMYFLADYLQGHGYDVYVVHAQRSEYSGDYGHQIQFHSIPIKLTTEISSDRSTSDDSVSLKSVNSGKWKMATIGFIKSIIKQSNFLSLERIVFNEPLLGLGLYGYIFGRNARKKIFRTIFEHKVRHVIISGPPFSLFGLAPQIKKHFPEVNIILDYRDPWNTPNQTYCISSIMERNALAYADKVVFINDRMRSDISLKYNLPNEKCAVVFNGYSKLDWDEVFKNTICPGTNCGHPLSDRMIIGHIGSISFNNGGHRDLSSFLEAFQLFQNDKHILLRFVGIKSSDIVEKIKQQFPENLEILPPVNTRIALNYMLECDVLFLNHTDEKTGRYVLTGKFFDYIRSGKVILGIANNEETYFLKIIQQHQLGIVCSSQSTQIFECLELLYKKWMTGSLQELRKDDGLDIEELSRENQNSKYLQLLENLESNKSTT